ncbi:MAG TPA: hypothetical protein PKV16_05525 [Caldisericia bacterium]|nr:hypothetical protein [Caldisericia bacterium]HPF48772.1 hypothetical protein [Caldisericia bacterium]HPI83568.1 hypothetical protein [Caldisericia bacterium]HPQ93227.1 hypothetical protein [Caldisericia bacterium]HRV74940.1 hypothetical protein [Caldisericia bacterium]
MREKLKNKIVVIVAVLMLVIGCGKSPNGNSVSNNTDPKVLLSGKWYSASQNKPLDNNSVESLFQIGHSEYTDIKIDDYGKMHICYYVSYKTGYNTETTQPNCYVVGKKCEWKTLLGENAELLMSKDKHIPLLPDGKTVNVNEINIDKDGRTHFIGDSCYLIWNGSNWTTLKGDVATKENVSEWRFDLPLVHRETLTNATFKLDSSGRPVIVFFRGYTHKEKISYIHYVRWDGEKWVTFDGKEYDCTDNDGEVYRTDDSINQVELLLDGNNIPYIVWSEKKDQKPSCIKGVLLSKNSWEEMGFDSKKAEIVDMGGKTTFPKVRDFEVEIDTINRLHLAWEYKATDSSPRTFCYMYYDGDWKNIDNEVVMEDLGNTVVPVSIDHISKNGHLHHIGYLDDFNLLHTMWNGTLWTRVDGEPTRPEGDNSCVFYRNYNGQMPVDFIIQSYGNNLYMAWTQWSKDGVGIGVNSNLHYMEWIEDTQSE